MISLQKTGNTIVFTFQDSPHYLFNGTIEVPVNSLTLVTDESDMATFRKSASNDIFISALYSELGMSKAELINWYKNNMVSHFDEADAQALIDASTADFFDDAEYDSQTKRINFKHGSTVKGYIDATDFIKDGMVDNVAISGSNLVITFNTESGKEPISIPLSSFFDASAYYTKTEVDEALSFKQDTLTAGDGITIDADNVISSNAVITVDTALDSGSTNPVANSAITTTLNTKEEVIATALNTLNTNKLDASAYTPTDLSNYYTKSETSGATEISTALNTLNTNKLDVTAYTPTDLSNYYTKSEVNTALGGKQDTLVSGTNIKTINSESILGSGDIVIEGGNNVISLTQAEYDELSEIDPDALYVITDASSVDIDDYYTKSETSGATQISTALAAKQNTLSAGTNISIVNDVISAEGGGASYTAGHAIDLTNDVISMSLPISAGTGTNSIIGNDSSNIASGESSFAIGSGAKALGHNSVAIGTNVSAYTMFGFAEGYGTKAGTYQGQRILGAHAEGKDTVANGEASHAEGNGTTADGQTSHAEGNGTTADGQTSHAEGNATFASSYAHAEGNCTSAMTMFSHTEGWGTKTSNKSEHASGQFNATTSASTTFGDSGNTLFSVGNGTSDSRHNAFEIRQNGDIYCSNGTNDVKLQDYLQVKVVQITQSDYDALAEKDSSTLYVIIN